MMTFRWTVLLLVMGLLTSGGFAGGPRPAPRPKAVADDGWTGTYVCYGGHQSQGQGRTLRITKEGDRYRLELKPYESFDFVAVKAGVLESKSLGKIYRGALRFEDTSMPATTVLRAELCYEQFYLVRLPDEATGEKARAK